MLGIVLRLHVKPGKMDELLEFLKWDADVARKSEPGTLRFDVYQEKDNASALLLYEAYESAEAFESHKQQEPFKKFGEIRERCVESMDVLVGGAEPKATNYAPN